MTTVLLEDTNREVFIRLDSINSKDLPSLIDTIEFVGDLTNASYEMNVEDEFKRQLYEFFARHYCGRESLRVHKEDRKEAIQVSWLNAQEKYYQKIREDAAKHTDVLQSRTVNKMDRSISNKDVFQISAPVKRKAVDAIVLGFTEKVQRTMEEGGIFNELLLQSQNTELVLQKEISSLQKIIIEKTLKIERMNDLICQQSEQILEQRQQIQQYENVGKMSCSRSHIEHCLRVVFEKHKKRHVYSRSCKDFHDNYVKGKSVDRLSKEKALEHLLTCSEYYGGPRLKDMIKTSEGSLSLKKYVVVNAIPRIYFDLCEIHNHLDTNWVVDIASPRGIRYNEESVLALINVLNTFGLQTHYQE